MILPVALPRPFALLRAVAALLLLFAAAPGFAQSFPKFTGFVVDAANVLPADQEAALTAKLDALQKDTGRQLIVATIPDLQGYAIEDYGYRLGRAWGVGLKGVDNGAILIVAPADRKVRVEVGYGLTPVLTDAFSSVVIQSQILPAFRAGNLPAGIMAGTDALIAQLRLPDAEARAKVDAAVKAHDRAEAPSPIAIIFWVIVILVIVIAMVAANKGGRRHRRGGSNVWVWGPVIADVLSSSARSGRSGGFGSSSGGGWMGGGFSGGGGGSFGGGGASGSW